MATAAQMRANAENAKRSKGPVTPEGKRASSRNSYKHGMTATAVLPEREAAEVDRRFDAFCRDLNPQTELEVTTIRRAVVNSVRMERCVEYEKAMLTERVRLAEAAFVPPEGVDAATAERSREEAGRRALFDPSPEATLARRYEQAAEQGLLPTYEECVAYTESLRTKK